MQKEKITLTAILIAGSCFLTYYFHELHQTGTVFTHFFYVPIILAAFWWKRKGLAVAIFLSVFLIFCHYFLKGYADTANDYLRAIMFVVIGFIAATLSERLARAEVRIARHHSVLHAIRNVNQMIVREKDRDRLLSGICDELIKTGYFYNTWIALLDVNGGLAATVAAGLEKDFLPMVEQLKRGVLTDCGSRALQQSDVVVTEDPPSTCTDCPIAHTYAGRGAISVRLEYSGRVYGILCASIPRDYLSDETEMALFKEVAGDIAFALHDMELEEERKQAEEDLKKVKERAEQYLNIAGAMMAAVSADESITLINNKGCEILGYNEGELIGGNWFDILVPERIRTEIRDVFGKIMSGDIESFEYYENPLLTKDGKERLISFHNALIRDPNGQIVGVLLSGEDITEAKSAEKEKEKLESQLLHAQKMEAVGTLAGGVAHDFNNLLQAIQGYSDILLLDKNKDEPGYRELQEIRRAGQRASELTQQLLTFSQKVESKLRPVDLNHEVKQVERLLKRTIPKMIKIELHLADKLNTIDADPAQIEQVMMNLGVNARDAMPEGGTLIIETENVTLDEEYCNTHLGAIPGDYVLLTVSDTGHGMDKETLKHIFEPFYTTKEAGKGTGLGLAIVFGIVKSHNGYIMCYSEPGEGTAFKIYIPAIEQEAKLEELKEEKMPIGGTETILLVDDEEPIREVGKNTLAKFGYKVIIAPDGESALELYREKKKKIDLIILDLIMPGMGGRKCLERLLKINPRARVLIASGYSVDELTKKALEAVAKGFISKPYDIKQMLKAVRETLDKN
ncbi:MAG: response regulator [Deltaproteobacteria bacterium]|nr:response regulator [Deltaproteobacteria bacterium]